MKNCSMHKHLTSSGKVKTQQDSNSSYFHESVHPGEGDRDAAAVWTAVLIMAQYDRRLLGLSETLKAFPSGRDHLRHMSLHHPLHYIS